MIARLHSHSLSRVKPALDQCPSRQIHPDNTHSCPATCWPNARAQPKQCSICLRVMFQSFPSAAVVCSVVTHFKSRVAPWDRCQSAQQPRGRHKCCAAQAAGKQWRLCKVQACDSDNRHTQPTAARRRDLRDCGHVLIRKRDRAA